MKTFLFQRMNGKKRSMIDVLTNLKIRKEDVPKRVLVCGDPTRAEVMANELTNGRLLGKNREYHSYVGTWKGTEIAIISHGVGGPGAAVCFEEIAMADVEVIIRVGTAGSYQKEIKPGSLVVSTAAVRCDGLSNQIVPAGFPAVADRKVVAALSHAADILGHEDLTFEGITLTLDAFYSGSISFPHDVYQRSNVLAVEMENAALLTIASLRKVRAGAILAIDGYADADLREEYNPNTDVVKKAVELEVAIALDAIIAL